MPYMTTRIRCVAALNRPRTSGKYWRFTRVLTAPDSTDGRSGSAALSAHNAVK